jgi:Xaa-Pro aminopeptidase
LLLLGSHWKSLQTEISQIQAYLSVIVPSSYDGMIIKQSSTFNYLLNVRASPPDDDFRKRALGIESLTA